MAKHNFSVAQVIMGRRLQELRCARGMSVLEFVHKGWTRDPAIARIERGEMNPNLEFIARACGVLRAHPASLFTSCEFPFGSEFTRDELVAHVAGTLQSPIYPDAHRSTRSLFAKCKRALPGEDWQV
jgi:transcriptional regulator with XRE-family HTH domain